MMLSRLITRSLLSVLWAAFLGPAAGLPAVHGDDPALSRDELTPTVRADATQSILDKIQTQADLIQRQQESIERLTAAQEDYLAAVKKLSIAKKSKDQTSINLVRDYWGKKSAKNLMKWMDLEETLERRRMPMITERARLATVWERAKGQPERYRYAVRKGDFLNFMMQHIDTSSGLSSGNTMSKSVTNGLMNFDLKFIDAITVQVPQPGGAQTISLTQPLPSIFSRWPYSFRDPSLRSFRDEVTARAKAVFENGKTDDQRYEASVAYERAMQTLTSEFYKIYPPEKNKSMTLREGMRRREAERFLLALENAVAQVAEQSTSGTYGQKLYSETYPQAEWNIATLCRFMMQYGIQFGPASKGSETAYDRLFGEMRLLSDILNVDADADWVEGALVDYQLDEKVLETFHP